MSRIDFPFRINKYMAHMGMCTRRKADEYIKAGLVTINGRVAVLGEDVQAGDVVELHKDTAEALAKNRVYVLYNKPVGIVTEEVKLPASLPKGLFPVGRLDKESEGLLLFTNDGRITDRLLNPDREHEKEYIVRVDKRVPPRTLRALSKGVSIEGYKTRPAHAEEISEKSFRITLTEGKKHQIRRMCAALGFQVKSLQRVRIMNLEIGMLAPGDYYVLTEDSAKEFLASLGL